MRQEEQQEVRCGDGSRVAVRRPVVVSASRRCDLPAFYADWFFGRLRAGYSACRNPFNGRWSRISYEATRFIVFWSKNPAPLLARLDELHGRGLDCYVQYTLNDYVREELEPGVPPLDRRMETFLRLADWLGPERVIWRADPLMISDRLGVEELLERTARIGDRLHGATERLVFSFADIAPYRKVRRRLDGTGGGWREWQPEEMARWAAGLAELNGRWGFRLETCAEAADLSAWDVEHGRCVDEALMARLAHDDQPLMEALGLAVERDEPSLFGAEPVADDRPVWSGDGVRVRRVRRRAAAGQRPGCGYAASVDVGAYDTCPHGCVYCYANTSAERVEANRLRHAGRPDDETLTGEVPDCGPK